MKLIIVLLAIASMAVAAPVDEPDRAQVLRYENTNDGLGNYKFAYETSDGISRQEEGVIKNLGTENEILSVTGAISWVALDGQTYTINFIADENGFQPVLGGAHVQPN